ncbi:adenosylcobinamide-phosphate synthase CbiB [Halobacillus sp. A5]|uniref:adenosylcobinamide-phosphate synthase CbiB n=1 Tax=Halobacillus sp. A5 TaxID=2880263 RepID=UPI0020A623F9|nr:adenosylcobinamide-phosphate synthase CbiB [Halobacillus sp. A5]MCP3027864.1 adenosylcobinamide-phosphate synthase CbiB [Halobacillus sp. A5]
MTSHLIALTLAFFLDLWLGDPRWLPHPVVMIGRLIAYLEKKWNQGSYRRLKGSMMLLMVCGCVFAISSALVWGGYQLHFTAGLFLEAVLIWTTIAGKGLKQAAAAVYKPLIEKDFIRARQQLAMIVGRDTEQLGEAGITRGTVETVAENTSDGVTAPLFFAFVGGAPLAMVYRAVNTCDSMVGYRHERYRQFGWASARFDDVVNYLPARMTAWLLLLGERSRYHQKKEVFRLLPHQAERHPSPNSGWGEAAFALLLGIQLGGKNYYFGEASYRPVIGVPREELQAYHILQSTKLMMRAVVYFLIFLWIGGVLIEMAVSWR